MPEACAQKEMNMHTKGFSGAGMVFGGAVSVYGLLRKDPVSIGTGVVIAASSASVFVHEHKRLGKTESEQANELLRKVPTGLKARLFLARANTYINILSLGAIGVWAAGPIDRAVKHELKIRETIEFIRNDSSSVAKTFS